MGTGLKGLEYGSLYYGLDYNAGPFLKLTVLEAKFLKASIQVL